MKFENVRFEINTADTGNRLKKLRKQQHLTIEELAEQTGLSNGMISGTETGKNKPSPNLLFALVKLFNVNLNWLLTGEGEMFMGKGNNHPGTGMQQKTDKGEYSRIYNQLLWYLENVPVVRYAVLGFFSEFKHRYKDRINKHGD